MKLNDGGRNSLPKHVVGNKQMNIQIGVMLLRT